jgi:hypothetical protein
MKMTTPLTTTEIKAMISLLEGTGGIDVAAGRRIAQKLRTSYLAVVDASENVVEKNKNNILISDASVSAPELDIDVFDNNVYDVYVKEEEKRSKKEKKREEKEYVMDSQTHRWRG